LSLEDVSLNIISSKEDDLISPSDEI